MRRDPEPRLHIPIITNPGCLMVRKNAVKHMPADGSVWITNNCIITHSTVEKKIEFISFVF